MAQKKSYLRNWQQNFRPFFGKNYQEELSFKRLFSIPKAAVLFVGLITYKTVFEPNFKANNSIEWKLFLCPVAVAASNAGFILNAMIRKFQGDVYAALAVLPEVLTGLLLAIQAVRFYFWKNKIQSLLRDLMNSWNRELKLGISDEVAKNAKRSILRTRCYAAAIAVAGLTYILRPVNAFVFHTMLYENDSFMNVKVLPGSYPFAVNNLMKYVLCNVWESIVIILVAIAWVASDAVFLQSATVVSLHFQIIGDKLRSVVKENDVTGNDTRLINRLTKIGRQHSAVLRFCHRMEKLFTPAMFSVMLYTSMSLCICLISGENEISKKHFMSGLKFLLHFLCVLVQTAVYCSAADNISYWSKSIAQAAADCQWVGHSAEFNRILMLIILRGQNPYEFKAYGFYTVNKIQLAKIVTLAINLFTLMRSAKSFALS